MKVSLNTVKYHSNVSLDVNVETIVQKIGAQLGAVEEVTEYAPRYEGIVVAKVVTCEKHPNADKLSVCTIDDGGITPDVNRDSNGYVQVVCGAPNVRAGLIVAWIPPGAIVPVTYDNDKFMLEARELRGVISNGMLASASELGISIDHSGLLEIKAEDVGENLTKPGTEFVKLYGLDDVIIDIENKMFTHRPDCFGVLGVARELSGIFNKAYTSPQWYIPEPVFKEENRLPLRIDNKLPDLVPRFMAVVMDNIHVRPSPIWMQALLSRIGVKSINNIVDITNYVSYLTGQPLHAYDYDKVASLSSAEPTITIRYPHENETVALLNGKTITPRSSAIMIATDKELIGVGGVMGGTTTEVDEHTTKIIIECANFDMYSIRRTSMEHGLFTDAVTRFTKKQSIGQIPAVMNHAMQLMQELGGATQASKVVDGPKTVFENGVIEVLPSFINERLGTNLSINEIAELLTNVEFEVSTSEILAVKPPFWRTDISIKEDIVEEVARLHGFSDLPLRLPQRTVNPVTKNELLGMKQKLRSELSMLGANEVLTYSFVHGNLLKKVGQDTELAFKLTNALSPDLQYYRLSLVPSLLQLVHPNSKSGHEMFALFELNKVHQKSWSEADEQVPAEKNKLAFVLAAKSGKKAAYFQTKAYLNELARLSNIHLEYRSLETDETNQAERPFDPKRSAAIYATETGEKIGIIGECKASVLVAMKLPVYTGMFELDVEKWIEATQASTNRYIPLSKYPSITQDVCFEVNADMPYAKLERSFTQISQNILKQDKTVTSEPLDIYFDPNRSDVKRITFRVTVTSYTQTLQEAYVTHMLDEISKKLESSLGAKRI